jgi:GT2 family glycosyltransferase
VYIADDAEADKHWLENILEVFNEYDDVYAVSGPTISINPQEMLAFFNKASKSRLLGLVAKIYNSVALKGKFHEIGVVCESGAYSIGGVLPLSMKIKKPIEVDLLTMTNVGIRRSLLVELKGFDERYFFHYDGDFWIKARRKGYKFLFHPKVIVKHYVSPYGSSRSAYYIGRDYAIFYLKNFHPSSLSWRFRLMFNILCFNLFWIYKALSGKNLKYFNGIKGFVIGCIEFIKKYRFYKETFWRDDKYEEFS